MLPSKIFKILLTTLIKFKYHGFCFCNIGGSQREGKLNCYSSARYKEHSLYFQFTTDEFGCKFIQTVAQNPHNWIDRVSHHFVGQCFRAVGMNFKVSLDAFRKTYDHPYRDDNLTYIFNAVPFVLNGVEAFLQRLPSVLHIYELELAKDRPTARLGAKFYELTRPVPCYLRVVDVWTQVVRYITENLQHTDNTVDKFLCEPLARLSVSMLCGLVKLLPDSEDKYDHLKDMCLRLAVLARYGIL